MSTTYDVDDAWVVADDDGHWRPGVYDSEETARRASALTDAQLYSIAHVWQVDGEDRPATLTDLAAVSSSAPSQSR